MDTSSRAMLKFLALSVRIFLISLLTACHYTKRQVIHLFSEGPASMKINVNTTFVMKKYLSLRDKLTGIVLCNHSFECFMNDWRQNSLIVVLPQGPVHSW
jgi:hypothetical protein